VNPTEVLIAKLNLLLANSEEILRHLPASLTAASNVQAQLLTVAEAAIYLGRTPQSIQHLIFEKQLPHRARGSACSSASQRFGCVDRGK